MRRRMRQQRQRNGRASAKRRGDPLESLLDITLGNAAMAAILALVAAAIGRVYRRPALTHALWVLVLIKLVTPPLWKLPMHGVLARALPTRGAAGGLPVVPVVPTPVDERLSSLMAANGGPAQGTCIPDGVAGAQSPVAG